MTTVVKQRVGGLVGGIAYVSTADVSQSNKPTFMKFINQTLDYLVLYSNERISEPIITRTQ